MQSKHKRSDTAAAVIQCLRYKGTTGLLSDLLVLAGMTLGGVLSFFQLQDVGKGLLPLLQLFPLC